MRARTSRRRSREVALQVLYAMDVKGRGADVEEAFEQAALVLGILEFQDILRGRSLIWFEDNSAVLSGLVKGASGCPLLDAGAASIHLPLAALQARAWFEYVESDANWSDGASRLLLADPWAAAHGFPIVMNTIPTWPWEAQGSSRISCVEQSLA